MSRSTAEANKDETDPVVLEIRCKRIRKDADTRRAEISLVLMAAADGLMLSVGYGKRPPAALGKDPLPGLVDRLMELALL
jgi:hypothetical protein